MGWPRALHPRRSPCRIDAGKGRHQHRCSASHAGIVDGYCAYRDAAYAAAEDATGGYGAELAEYWQSHERPTLRAYLLAMRQPAA